MVRELHTLGASSLEVTFYKGFFTVILIGGYYLFSGKYREQIGTLKKKHVFPLLVFGVIFLYGNTTYAEALQHTKVMNILVIIYLSIFLGILSGWIFFDEKITKYLILWASLAFGGIVLTLYNGDVALHF